MKSLMLLTVLLAPLPSPEPKPAKKLVEIEPIPGNYIIHWNPHKGHGVLRKDGTYAHIWNEKEYIGTWEWNKKMRILTLNEMSETTPLFPFPVFRDIHFNLEMNSLTSKDKAFRLEPTNKKY